MSRPNQVSFQNPLKEGQKNFRAIVQHAQDVEYYVKQLEELINSESSSKMDSTVRHRQVDSIFSNGNAAILQEKQRILEMLQKVSDVMNARRIAQESGVNIPSIERLRELVFQFMNEKLPTLPSPYAPLCGAIPLPQDQIIPNGYY